MRRLGNLAVLGAVLVAPQWVAAAEWSGLVDLRAVSASSTPSWVDSGLGKLRYDSNSSPLDLGQAILAVQQSITDDIDGNVVLNAATDRDRKIDLQEAWLGWSPVPTSAWKWRGKAGVFFPPIDMETDYSLPFWTPERTVSASAINSWVGDELRGKGVELSVTHLGRFDGSPHDVGATIGLFTGNDPTGTLLTWRGWTIGDRIAGVTERIRMADLPVYSATGPFRRQSRDDRPMREIDGRVGYYAAVHYAFGSRVEVNLLHYDNRADPTISKDAQFAWRTRFDHVGVRIHPGGQWELLFQAMDGDTLLGRGGAYVDYRAAYALASHPLGAGKLTVRFDNFSVHEEDNLPSDPNGEHGHGLALAYLYPLTSSLTLVTELLEVRSTRAARVLIGENSRQTERSAVASIRWQF